MRLGERRVTVVIPTRNRPASVERALDSLSTQSYPVAALEVIVVADGCDDGTPRIVAGSRPFSLRVIDQPASGPAAARNRGAAAARGDLLIFMDDDIEAWPGFIAAHVQAHADRNPARVAIGYLPPQLQGRRDFFAIMLRTWWEAMFEHMRDPGHRFTYSNLLSGNFSVSTTLFTAVGAFDESLRCHEDYELGFRLIGAGAQFSFAPEAAGWHHERTDLGGALERKRAEGRADVALARRHPGLAPVLPLSASESHLSRRGRALKRRALASPAGGAIETGLCSMLPLLEAARLRVKWRSLLYDLLSYWYWRGVGESLGGASLDSLRLPGPPVGLDPCEIDLQYGLEAAMRQLDSAGAAAIVLRWDRLVVGTIEPRPGAEPLRGRHLPSLLRQRFRRRFPDVLALTSLLEAEGPSERPVTAVADATELRSAWARR